MAFLIEKFAVAMAVAALLGVFIGWISCSRREPTWKSSWLPFAIIAFVLGMFAAAQYLFPGRPGLWLESALLMFASYMAGCCIGCFLRSLMLGPDLDVERDPHTPDYTMKVAGISLAAAPAIAATFPYRGTVMAEMDSRKTYALRSSATDYTLMAAGVNTTAAASLAQVRDPSIEAEAARRRALRNAPDSYTLAVAGVNTTAGRNGVASVGSGFARSDAPVHSPGQAGFGAPAASPVPAAFAHDPAAAGIAGKQAADDAAARAARMNMLAASAKAALPISASTAGDRASNAVAAAKTAGAAGMAVAAAASTKAAAIAGGVTGAVSSGSAAVSGAAASAAAAATSKTSAVDSLLMTHKEPPRVGVRPPLYSGPRGGKKDDLTLIWGVAEKLEEKMNSLGIWHFEQIAVWTPDHIKWFEFEMQGFRDRLERDKWVEQSKKLADGWRPDRNIGERPKV